MANLIIPYTGQPLQTGDVLVVKAVLVVKFMEAFIRHYAIVYQKDGIQYVAEHKPLSHGLRTNLLSNYLNDRAVTGLVRSDKTMALTDDYIQKKVNDCSPIGYRLLTYNCEDFIRDICDCDIGYDQRKKFLNILLLSIIAIILLYFLFTKKNHQTT